jgi:hypothetical protein
MQRQPRSLILPQRRVETAGRPVDQAAHDRSRRTSNPLYPALPAPRSEINNAGCEANNDGFFLSAFQFLSPSELDGAAGRPDALICRNNLRGIAVGECLFLCVTTYALAIF